MLLKSRATKGPEHARPAPDRIDLDRPRIRCCRPFARRGGRRRRLPDALARKGRLPERCGRARRAGLHPSARAGRAPWRGGQPWRPQRVRDIGTRELGCRFSPQPRDGRAPPVAWPLRLCPWRRRAGLPTRTRAEGRAGHSCERRRPQRLRRGVRSGGRVQAGPPHGQASPAPWPRRVRRRSASRAAWPTLPPRSRPRPAVRPCPEPEQALPLRGVDVGRRKRGCARRDCRLSPQPAYGTAGAAQGSEWLHQRTGSRGLRAGLATDHRRSRPRASSCSPG